MTLIIYTLLSKAALSKGHNLVAMLQNKTGACLWYACGVCGALKMNTSTPITHSGATLQSRKSSSLPPKHLPKMRNVNIDTTHNSGNIGTSHFEVYGTTAFNEALIKDRSVLDISETVVRPWRH